MRERGEFRLAGHAIEHRIEIVQRMADLVELLRRLLLEKETDGATRVEEVAVSRMALVASGEERARRPRIGAPAQLRRPRL